FWLAVRSAFDLAIDRRIVLNMPKIIGHLHRLADSLHFTQLCKQYSIIPDGLFCLGFKHMCDDRQRALTTTAETYCDSPTCHSACEEFKVSLVECDPRLSIFNGNLCVLHVSRAPIAVALDMPSSDTMPHL
ncbi:MAG: hypothetical protein NTU78_15885, partial [Alphaproteobacteria bacterium]|nr:hypothetical protein [Alphaproteobacteria bacterium]